MKGQEIDEAGGAGCPLLWRSRAESAEADAAATQRLYMAAVRRRDVAEEEVRRLMKAQLETAEAARLYLAHSESQLSKLKAERDALKAEQSRGAAPAICTWTEQDPWGPTPLTWDGTCGVTYYVSEGSLAGNKVHFCPECGGRIVEVPWPPDDSDEGDEVAR